MLRAGLLILVVVLAAGSVRRAEGRGRHWAMLATASGALAAAWLGPIGAAAASGSLSAHLLQLTVVMGVVPPVLLLAVRMPTPRRVTEGLAEALWHPATALILFNAVFFVTNVPAVHDAGVRWEPLGDLCALAMLGVSLLFWRPIVRSSDAFPPVARLFYIVLATIPQTFAGLLLMFSRHRLYATGPGAGGLADQQLAGAMLALLSKIALFTAFAVILVRLFHGEPDAGDDDGGRGHEPSGAPTPSAPVRRLALLRGRRIRSHSRRGAWARSRRREHLPVSRKEG